MSKTEQEKLQGLYDYYLEELGRTTALVAIDKAGDNYATISMGRKIEIEFLLRRLVDLGCRSTKQESEE